MLLFLVLASAEKEEEERNLDIDRAFKAYMVSLVQAWLVQDLLKALLLTLTSFLTTQEARHAARREHGDASRRSKSYKRGRVLVMALADMFSL